MVDIEWEDPPALAIARVRTPGKYLDWAYAIRSQPGRWAKLPQDEEPRSVKGAANLAQSIRRGQTAGFKPKGAYDAVPDEGNIWVRFVGDPEPTPEPPPPPSSMGDRDHEPGSTHDRATRGEGDHEGGSELEGPPRRVEPDREGVNPAEVRAWAQNNGFNVPTRGRMEQKVWDAYHKAHRPRHVQAVPDSAEG